MGYFDKSLFLLEKYKICARDLGFNKVVFIKGK